MFFVYVLDYSVLSILDKERLVKDSIIFYFLLNMFLKKSSKFKLDFSDNLSSWIVPMMSIT